MSLKLKHAAGWLALAFICGAWHPGGYEPNATYALSFSGSPDETHVDHGPFWVPSTTLTNLMFWRTWIKKNDANGGYVISDGYGGAHALLWDVDGAGNIYFTPGGTVSYGSDDTMPVGQWYESSIAIANDSVGAAQIVTRMNGIPVGETAVPSANTRAVPPPGGVGTLYVGGSTHINAHFQIAELEGFDTTNPLGSGGSIFSYAPERRYSKAADGAGDPDFFADYTVPSKTIADLSWGYAGGVTPTLTNRVKHPGNIFNNALGTPNNLAGQSPTAYPVPKWVSASDGPWTTDTAPTPPGGRTLTPPVTPVGAKIFDSFSRQDQTYAYSNSPTLGSTEAGSLGPLAWNTGVTTGFTANFPAQWGIFNGRAVFLDVAPTVAWVNNNSSDMDVLVDNRVGTYGNGDCSLAFRVQDKDNFWVVEYWWNSTQGAILAYGKVVAGVYTGVANTGFTLARAQHTFEAVTSGTSITIKMDGVTKFTTTDATLQTATGAGIAIRQNGSNEFGLARWDNFTVK